MFEIVSVTKLSGRELSAIDLREEALASGGEAARVEIAGQAQRAEVLVVGDRAGVAWGADATWIDLRDGETAEDAVRIVLNGRQEGVTAVDTHGVPLYSGFRETLEGPEPVAYLINKR